MLDKIKKYKNDFYFLGTYLLVLFFGMACGYLYCLSSSRGSDSNSITQSVNRAQELNTATEKAVNRAELELDRASENLNTTSSAVRESSELNSRATGQLEQSSGLLKECSDTNSRAEQLINSIISGAQKTEGKRKTE